MATLPQTVGDLRRSEYGVASVKAELRRNLIRKLGSGEPLFPGIRGYDDTVLPQLENAILAGQAGIVGHLRIGARLGDMVLERSFRIASVVLELEEHLERELTGQVAPSH